MPRQVHIHIHKRTADAKPYWRVLIDGKLYCTENSAAEAGTMVTKLKADPQHKGKTITSVEASTTAGAGITPTAPRKLFGDARDAAEPEAGEKQALIRDFLIKTETKDKDVAVQYLRAKSWDLDRAVQGWERLNKTADHRLDFKPDTDADRRARIQEVMRATGVTHNAAVRWLEAEEWITDTTIRELKHAIRLGFTVDAADPVAKMDDEVRAAYSKLCQAFTAGSPGIRQLRSDFIAKVYAYGKKAGRDHPLARVMDSAAPTGDADLTGKYVLKVDYARKDGKPGVGARANTVLTCDINGSSARCTTRAGEVYNIKVSDLVEIK
jgi:hypothetical protein